MIVSVKSLRIDRITNRIGRNYLDRHHPLGAGANFLFALGVFAEGHLFGVMTIGGPGTNKAGKCLGLRQYQLFELRKMHLSDALPRNSESRCLSIMIRLVRKHYPDIKAIITYCDSEDKAAAYKAAGWKMSKSYRYVRQVKIGGRWMSIRNANRHGLRGQTTERHYESRVKWIYPISPEVAALV